MALEPPKDDPRFADDYTPEPPDDGAMWEPSSDVRQKVVSIATKKPLNHSDPDLATLGGTLLPAIARAERRKKGDEKPVPVPFPQYAEALRGGFWPGVHSVIAGTGAGKSTFMFQVATHAAKSGIPVLYIGLELGEFQVALRAMGDAAGVRWSSLYTGQVSDDDLEKARAAIPDLMNLPFYVEFNTEQGWSPSNLSRRAKRIRDEHATGPMLIVLDFLQLVGADAEDGGRRQPELRERIARAAYAAVHTANTYNAAVVLISSTARNNYGKLGGSDADLSNFITRDVPGLFTPQRAIKHSDALIGMGKESGEIEFAVESQTVLVRWPGRLETGESVVICALAKLRYGLSTWVPMSFWHDYRELPFRSTDELPGADQVARPGRPGLTDASWQEQILDAVRQNPAVRSKSQLLGPLSGTRQTKFAVFNQLVAEGRIMASSEGFVVREDFEPENLQSLHGSEPVRNQSDFGFEPGHDG